MAEPPEPTRLSEPIWLEPYPDVLLEGMADSAPGPHARYEMREAVGLAFVAALQHLRAVLILRDALGFSGAEVATMLDTTETAVKAALQRARAKVDEEWSEGDREGAPAPRSRRERELVRLFTAAVERGDTEGIVSLLADDAWVRMPPQPYEYQGHSAVAAFLRDRAMRRGALLRLVPTRANGQPAFACYLPDAHAAIARAYGLMVLTLQGERISAITWFGDRSLFPHFGLPRTLPA
jgi:RNA polymerase sigma-70 factor (ECF subfamily)